MFLAAALARLGNARRWVATHASLLRACEIGLAVLWLSWPAVSAEKDSAQAAKPKAAEPRVGEAENAGAPGHDAADLSGLLAPPPSMAQALSPLRGTELGSGEESVCRPDPAELKVLSALRARRFELDGRERVVALREAELKAAQAKVDGRITQLQRALSALEARLELGEPGRAAHEQRLRTLVDSLSSLSAKKAAPMLAEAEPALVSDLLQRLGATRTASLLTVMPTAKAARIINITGGPRLAGVRHQAAAAPGAGPASATDAEPAGQKGGT